MLPTSRYAGRRLVRPGCPSFGNGSHRALPNGLSYPSYTPRRCLINFLRQVFHHVTGIPRRERKIEVNGMDPFMGIRAVMRHVAIMNALQPKPKTNLDLPKLDKKWQMNWAHGKEWIDSKGPDAEKAYVLPMFPYPSGDLHLGHLRVYTISDVLARFKHMQGYNVMHPIGWDAFGLPAENAAIERKIHPAVWTLGNIQKMKGQLEAMNGRWDWDQELATCDPNFYKHTQRLFLLLHERGLAYQAESFVNYDPVDKTVLANEQVDANGHSWRSGAKVEKRLLKQWFFKISEFRQELLDDLDHLAKNSAWPERVLAMQRNWIGKSQGARIKFPVIAHNEQTHSDIEVFTTRPNTLFGVQYVALASTHPIVQGLAKNDGELQAFLDTIPTLPPDSKAGYLLSHVRAINPLAYEESTPDATKAPLPIFVAPYVLGDYGDGAVMGVPGHDTRDHAFWKHNRGDDPVRMVIARSSDESTVANNQPFIHHGHLTSHCGPYTGITTAEATTKIVALLESKGLGSVAETWRLRDWLVSRQRYWGTPIPIIHCESCGPVPVPEDQLPVGLPLGEEHWTQGKTGNPLDDEHDWINTQCPKCGNAAKRDTDTMDTFVDSSWYFMRFPDAKNGNALFSPETANASLPVDIYIGGVEHAILHLLYARFISKFLATTPYWPAGSKHLGEPFKKVLAQGMVHGKTYSDPATGRFLKPEEVDLSVPSKPIIKASQQAPKVSFEKMSKSKYNGVDPGTCMSKYGADATRAHILFQAPVSEVLEWDEEKISGIARWLRKLHDHIDKFHEAWIAHDPRMEANPKSILLQHESQFEDCNDQVNGAKPIHALKGLDDFNRIHRANMPQIDVKAVKKMMIDRRNNMIRTLEQEKKIWRAVQRTIISVTAAYSKSHSLNTVVSDLMTLTNTIIETTSHVQQPNPNDKEPAPEAGIPIVNLALARAATLALLKMMAPITPAFSEDAWQKINRGVRITKPNILGFLAQRLRLNIPGTTAHFQGPPRSIFNEPFPTPDGTYALLAPQSMRCAVQVNGKLKFAVDVRIPDAGLEGKELEVFMVRAISGTEEGRALGRKVDLGKARKVVVVRGGKTVNFVL